MILRLSDSELAYMAGIFILAYNMCKAKCSNDFAKNGNSQKLRARRENKTTIFSFLLWSSTLLCSIAGKFLFCTVS